MLPITVKEKIIKEVVIVSCSRTAVGIFAGALKNVQAIDLGSLVLKDVLRKVGLPPALDGKTVELAPAQLKDQGLIDLEKKTIDWDPSLQPVSVDEVIMGNVLQAGQLGLEPLARITPTSPPAGSIPPIWAWIRYRRSGRS